jgi:RNA polymerase-binding transcription factor DksA
MTPQRECLCAPMDNPGFRCGSCYGCLLIAAEAARDSALARVAEVEAERDAAKRSVDFWVAEHKAALTERDALKAKLAAKTDAHDRDGKALMVARAERDAAREAIRKAVEAATDPEYGICFVCGENVPCECGMQAARAALPAEGKGEDHE